MSKEEGSNGPIKPSQANWEELVKVKDWSVLSNKGSVLRMGGACTNISLAPSRQRDLVTIRLTIIPTPDPATPGAHLDT